MTQMKKLVMKVDLHDDGDKRKALKIVSALPGVDSISMDMKDMKLTVIGTVDAVKVASKLRKFWKADIILLGPVKEPEKKEEPKKEEPKKEEAAKKEEPKKEEPKKEEPKKEAEEPKKEEPKKKESELALGIMPYRQYYPPMNRPYYPPPPNTYYYYPHQSVEENPNGCVIL